MNHDLLAPRNISGGVGADIWGGGGGVESPYPPVNSPMVLGESHRLFLTFAHSKTLFGNSVDLLVEFLSIIS